MKTLRIILVLLIPAFGIVSCSKSEIRPACAESSEVTTVSETTQPVNGRMRSDAGVEVEPPIRDIVGGGEDDRDGGEKKPKSVR